MNNYLSISYDNALLFLKNNISEEDLNTLYHNYGTEDIKELACIVSDEDLINLGYELQDSDKKQNVSDDTDYKYSDVMDIAKFLAHNIDKYISQQLIDKYQCCSYEDLALALTDDELHKLGYKNEIKTDDNTKFSDCCFELEPVVCADYDERLDYLEDIPYDLQLAIIDIDDGILAVADKSEYNRFCESVDSTLVEDISLLPDIVETSECLFKVTPKVFDNKQKINEEVIINTELNPEIFDSNSVMIPEIREQLLDYANGFINKMNDKDVKIDYSDICLIGSNAGYLYTPESDIDVHIISANPIDLDIAEKLFDECDIYEIENPLTIGETSNVELGIEDGYDITTNNKNERRYSILSNEWVNDSDRFEQFKPEDIEKVAGYEEIVDDYTNKINNAVDNDEYKIANELKQEIRQNRSDDLANIGSLSMGNVVFKELRNNGAYGKLRTYLINKDIVGEQQDE